MSKTRWFCASTSILVRTIHWNLWNLSLCHEFAFHSCRIWTFLRNVHQVVDFVLIRVEHLPTLLFFLIQKCSEMHAGFFPTFFFNRNSYCLLSQIQTFKSGAVCILEHLKSCWQKHVHFHRQISPVLRMKPVAFCMLLWSFRRGAEKHSQKKKKTLKK